jgi:hypothetical protein
VATPRGYRLLLAAALLAVLAFVAGSAYAAGPLAVTSSNTDAYRTSPAIIDLSDTGGVKSTILTLSLPAGSWIISADATALSNFGRGGYIRCALYQGSTKLDQAAVSLVMDTINQTDDLSLIGAVKGASSFTARLKCWEDTSIAPPYFNHIDAGAVLWAHKSSSLSL